MLGQELAVLPADLLGEGPAMLILGCVHLGELPRPCQVHGSVGGVYPVRPLLSPRYKVTPGGTTTVAMASSTALESAPAVTPRAPSLQGPGCSGGGAADLHSSGLPGSGRSVLALLCPPGLCLSQGEH